jgi:hypothetical protein
MEDTLHPQILVCNLCTAIDQGAMITKEKRVISQDMPSKYESIEDSLTGHNCELLDCPARPGPTQITRPSPSRPSSPRVRRLASPASPTRPFFSPNPHRTRPPKSSSNSRLLDRLRRRYARTLPQLPRRRPALPARPLAAPSRFEARERSQNPSRCLLQTPIPRGGRGEGRAPLGAADGARGGAQRVARRARRPAPLQCRRGVVLTPLLPRSCEAPSISAAVLTRSPRVFFLARVQDASEHRKMGKSEDRGIYEVRACVLACGCRDFSSASAWSGLDGVSFSAGRSGGTGELLLHHDRREWRARRRHPAAAPAEHRAAEGAAAASRDRAARAGPCTPADPRGTAQLPGSRQGACYCCGQAQGYILLAFLPTIL